MEKLMMDFLAGFFSSLSQKISILNISTQKTCLRQMVDIIQD